MSDLISKEELLNKVGRMQFCYEYGRAVSDIYHIIKDQPVIEAVPVVHGKWVKNGIGIRFCSKCGSEAYWDTDYGPQLFPCCPYCGARMDGAK